MLNRLANLGKNWKAYQCAVCGTIVKIDENQRKHSREIVFCNECMAYVNYLMHPQDDITDRGYKMPGGKTIAQMGGLSGSHHGEAVGNNLVIRCSVTHSDGTETTWDYHAYTGKVENQRREAAKVIVDRNDKGTFQARTKGGDLLFTFGPCQPVPNSKKGWEADRQREWVSKGFWFVSTPGKWHETYILTRKPVVDGVIQARWEDVVGMKTNPKRMLEGFSSITHAIINSDDYNM